MGTNNLNENGMNVESGKAVGIEFDVRKIITLEEYKAKGGKLAKLANNRDLDKKHIGKLKATIKKLGVRNPISFVKGIDVISKGYKILDFETETELSKDEAENYIVIVDGQHRTQAYLDLKKKEKDFSEQLLMLYSPTREGETLLEVLTEINTVSKIWNGIAFVKAVQLEFEKKYPLIVEMGELTGKDYSLESACKWLTFSGGITKTVLSKLGEKQSVKTEALLTNLKGVERGFNIIDSAKKRIDEKALKSRLIIDWIITQYEKSDDSDIADFENNMCNFFSELDREKAKLIESAKGVRGVSTKEDIIYKLLDAYYSDFEETRKETFQEVA